MGLASRAHGLGESEIVNGEKCGKLVSAGRYRW
jgi:hypothetical protein